MDLQKVMITNYGVDAELIEKELRGEVNDALSSGGDYDDIEDILFSYGLEMDYIMDLL